MEFFGITLFSSLGQTSILAIAAAVFIIGLYLTIKGGDWFVDSASWFAEATGIPKFVVGATVVSFATTLPELLTYLVMNSKIKSCGNFATSDEMLTKLYDMTVRSDLANFYYFVTDCPQREKNGWTADAALSAEQILLKFDATTSFREWMRNVCKAQNDVGALPGIVPTGGWGFSWGNGPAWDCVLAVIPYFCYKYRGDKQIIYDCAPAFVKYLHYNIQMLDINKEFMNQLELFSML